MTDATGRPAGTATAPSGHPFAARARAWFETLRDQICASFEAIEDDPGRWAHGPAWAERMRAWAGRCERLIVLSDSQVARAERLLGIEAARCVRVANGFDPETFRPRHVDHVAAQYPTGSLARITPEMIAAAQGTTARPRISNFVAQAAGNGHARGGSAK